MTSRRISDREKTVIETMRMHLRPKQALKYLEDHGHPMKEPTLYGWKRRINKSIQERLYQIAEYEFSEQHVQAIEELKAGRKRMWENIDKIKDPFKQNIAIQNLLNLLPLSSSYYDATKGVIQKPEQESLQQTPLQESEDSEPIV